MVYLPLLYDKLFCLRKKGEHEGAFPFLLMYCQHLLPSPITQPVLGLCHFVLLSLKKKNLCSFCSINITGRNCIYPKDVMYIICLLLPLLVIWPYRWPLARLVAIISRAMAYAGKYLDLLLEF